MPRTKQYAKRVNIKKYVKVGSRWRFAPIVRNKGKMVQDHVYIAGRDEYHPEGAYYLEWLEFGKRRRKSISDYNELDEAARLKAIEVEAMKAGLIAPPAEPLRPVVNLKTISAAVDHYLSMVEAQRSPKTYKSYRHTLRQLLVPCYTKNSVDDVCREDILTFLNYCYEKGLGHRTVYDKLVVVLQFFKRHGKTGLITSSDWPKYVETIRPIYEPEEVHRMLKEATEDESILLKFLLASGFRDQEVRHLCWRDIDFHNSHVRVTAKDRWRFRPKNWEERAVPLPTALMDRLQKLKESRNAVPAQLVFPNKHGNPDSNHDMVVKRVAFRAKLNCGQCFTKHGNRCSDGPFCHHFFLHKFRHTFATEHLRHGIDIRTLQSWLGHHDIQSTMVYLKGVHSKDALTKVNAGSLAAYVSQ